MWVKSIKLKNFRNYDFLQLDLDPATNIFYGDNAQGKTNLLEALYLSGTTKSHRGAKDQDLIQFGKEEAHIETIVERKKISYQIDVHLKNNKAKGIAINKKPIKKASDLFGMIHFIFFSPEDLNIIKNGPRQRRRFLDLELSQLDKVYYHQLASYRKIMNQRNVLLKEGADQKTTRETLSLWDEQLATYGNQIIERRKQFIEEINTLLATVHQQLTHGKEQLRLVYEPSNGETPLKKALEENLDRDFRMKSTSVGPHRDDLAFLVGDLDLRRYGSQGQQRTAALSLKLSELDLVKQETGEAPVLLLDDVLSELDQQRQNDLLDSIQQIQTLITCTGMDEFVNHRFFINQVFHVQQGQIVKEN